MISSPLQYWMDGSQNIHYGRLPKELLKSPTDILFWDWFDNETRRTIIHKGTVAEIKKYWHDNIYITASPAVDNASDLTMDIIGTLLKYFPNNKVSKSMTWSGHMIRKRLKFQGMDISIETPAGYLRTGKDPDGKQWRSMLHFDYGYVRGTKGVDGDHVDCFIGDYHKSDKVFVIHQKDVKTGKYDEDKAMLGWKTKTQAIKDYLLNYNRKDMFMGVTEMSIDEFKKKAYATAKNPKMIKAYNIETIAKKNKLDISKYNRKELLTGISVEREHMRDPKTKVAHSISDLLKIAVAHLKEDPKYYTKLATIEKPAKKSVMVKARVRAHTRTTPTGKIVLVREHQDSRSKKTATKDIQYPRLSTNLDNNTRIVARVYINEIKNRKSAKDLAAFIKGEHPYYSAGSFWAKLAMANKNNDDIGDVYLWDILPDNVALYLNKMINAKSKKNINWEEMFNHFKGISSKTK